MPRSAARESIPSIRAQGSRADPTVCHSFLSPGPCLQSKALQLSGKWDSELMSLLCNQLLLFEAGCPWCLMYFEWTFGRIAGLFVCFLMGWNGLQNQNYKNTDISRVWWKSLKSKDGFHHERVMIFLCVKTATLCEHIYTVVDILGTFIHMGTAQCTSSTVLYPIA